jgi:hypothetical protein
MAIREFQARRFPQWIRNALNLTTAQVPAALDTKGDANGRFVPIVATMDVFQGGLGVADIVVIDDALLTPGAGQITLVTPDPNFAFLLFALSWVSNALGATRNPRLNLQSLTGVPFSTFGLPLATVPTAASTTIAWKDVTGDPSARIYIPAGYGAAVIANDMAGGDQLTIRSAAFKLPSGFKPF